MTNSFGMFWSRNQKYAPVLFFTAGFIWDSLTLGRIDRLYDTVLLCTHMLSLSGCIYMYNLVDDGKWAGSFFERYEKYLPLAIQFFLGGLCSAFVIYFSRSVSFTKTFSFFIILVVLLFANELLKHRISNKYLQFSAYYFVSFTFFAFIIPVVIKVMSTFVFFISGLISLGTTLALIIYIYSVSPSTRVEISLSRVIGLIAGLYLIINTFYFFNLIPPVPLALETGIVAHNVEKINGDYRVTYQQEAWYKFWRDNSQVYYQEPGSNVYVFTSIFAPTDLKTVISHRWRWLNPQTGTWDEADNIRYEITGGRDEGFRGFTYKNNVSDGMWRVDVITDNGLILGIVKFEIVTGVLEGDLDLESRIF